MSAPGPDVLVTGLHRSGTTFVGDVLRHAGLWEIFEPANRDYGSVLVDRWKPYPATCGPDGRPYREIVDELATRPIRWKAALQTRNPALRLVGRALGMHRRAAGYAVARRRQVLFPRRRLFKDPDLVFCADDLERRHGFRVAILVRHPCAFYASVKRLGWRFPLEELLEQEELVDCHLHRYPEELHARPRSFAEEAAVLWLFVYTVVADLVASNPRLVLVRHEDLAERPLPAFRDLCRRLAVPFDARLQRRLETVTGGRRVDARGGHTHDPVRDAGALAWRWRESLDTDEQKRIRDLTAPIFGSFYSSWEPEEDRA